MSDERFSIEQFPEKLRQEKDRTARRVQQFLFNVSSAVQRQILANIKTTFTKTQRTNASGGSISSAKGLANSVTRTFSNGAAQITVGGVGAPYAAIHEYGGVIEPKRVKWLTIPALPALVGKRAAEFNDLKFVKLRPDLAALVFGSSWFPEEEDDDEDQFHVAFWLKKKVEMPKRPYIDPAVRLVINGPLLQEIIEKNFGNDEFLKNITLQPATT